MNGCAVRLILPTIKIIPIINVKVEIILSVCWFLPSCKRKNFVALFLFLYFFFNKFLIVWFAFTIFVGIVEFLDCKKKLIIVYYLAWVEIVQANRSVTSVCSFYWAIVLMFFFPIQVFFFHLSSFSNFVFQIQEKKCKSARIIGFLFWLSS